MLRAVVVASVLLGCSYWPAYADCAVEPWSIPYLGSNTSTTMLAGSGQVCQIYPSVGGTNVITSVTISAAPSNGSASVSGDAVLYQSQSGFTGQDSFAFTLSGSGPGGSGSSAVQVSVTVK
jgi:Bacterial Ig domain